MSAQVYKCIWRCLNQTSPNQLELTNLDNISFFEKEIQSSICNKESYKIITKLGALTSEEKAYLKDNNISIENLKLIQRDSLIYQEKYLNKFNYSIDYSFPREQTFVEDCQASQHAALTCFQQIAVATGYIHTICPITGDFLRSNQSFLLSHNAGIYRFESKEVFYIIATTYLHKKCIVFFPNLDLIIQINNIHPYPLEKVSESVSLVNRWKIFAVKNWKKILSNLTSEKNKKVVCCLGFTKNLAHSLRDEVSGIQRLYENGLLDRVDKFLLGPVKNYGAIEEIFPEISPEKIIKLTDMSQISELVLDQGYFALKAVGTRVQENLAKRIYGVAIKKSASSFVSEVENAKQYFPLLLITIRSSSRFWISKEVGLVNIIQKLATEFPNLAVVFDGVNDVAGASWVDQENEIVNRIAGNLPKNIRVYNSIGCKMHESIVWANAVNLYIAPSGAGITKISWLGNKPGVIHTNLTGLKKPLRQRVFNGLDRENGMVPIYVPEEHIVDSKGSGETPHYDSYECDWEWIYNAVFSIISDL